MAHVLDDHDGEVVGATVHATGDFMATASKDKSWAFYDINRCVPLFFSVVHNRGSGGRRGGLEA